MNDSDRMTVEERRRFFAIYVSGHELDVDTIIAMSPFRFDEVTRKGQQKKYSFIRGDHYKDSTITKMLVDPRELSVPEQDGVAINFIRKHYDYLKTISERSDVDRFHLGLSPTLEIERSTLAIGLCLSKELIKLLAELRMTVSLNVVPSIKDWKEEDGV